MSATPFWLIIDRLFCPFAAVILFVIPALADAQVPQSTPIPANPLAGVPIQVVQQQQVTIGAHTVTLNRIVPPAFPAATPSLTPSRQATPATTATTHATSLTARRTLSVQRSTRDASTDNDDSQPLKIFAVSATVYDHQFTKVSWSSSVGGQALAVYVNADFNYFSSIGIIGTDDASYELVMGLGNDTAGSLIQAGSQPPNLASFPSGGTSYQILTGNADEHAEDLMALRAFLSYYDSNQAQLIQVYQQQQAAAAAQKQWLQTHPPMQPNTVIDYWPVKSRVYAPPK